MDPNTLRHEEGAREAASRSQEDEAARSKRTQIACLNCRKRKSRCLLDSDNSIPCLRCKRDHLECVLGGSNRGGRRVRKKKTVMVMEEALSQQHPHPLSLPLPLPQPQPQPQPHPHPHSQPHQPLPSLNATAPEGSFHTLGNLGTWQESDGQGPYGEELSASRSGSSNTDELPFSNLQNPSDALGILAKVAGESSSDQDRVGAPRASTSSQARDNSATLPPPPPLALSYPLLDRGVLTVASLCQIVARFQQQYHPYYPLAPAHVFDTAQLSHMVTKEPHLLTAILLIASKDLADEPLIYEACSEHMKSLVATLAAGGEAGVEAVEALLLLTEWAPYTQKDSGKVGKGEEDKESWMHAGLALRIAYYLALDRYSFRVVDQGKDPHHHRKRLIWTSAYVSDRHISIRTGKAFWSRGPGPLTTLRREDYPTLIPKNPNEEDYASIFQANLELTQLFSNVHDTLYSNPGSSFRSHMSGSYIKFIDDFRSAIYGWKSVWGTLTCSPPLKACLLMSYDYLRLYTNAFAFQATLLRALPTATPSSDHHPNPPDAAPVTGMQISQRVFVNNVGAVSDARFIYEGLDAAKAILTTVNNFVDPERSLRFMPLRYYLYLVYAGVFLYRARCTGVISQDEDRAIFAMINETISRLARAAAGSGPGIQHPGSRYSQLLKLLWAKVPRKDRKQRVGAFRHPGAQVATNSLDPNGFTLYQQQQQSQQQSQQQQQQQQQQPHAHNLPQKPYNSTSQPSPGLSSTDTGESPALTEQMGDFGWTDLSAVSEFAVHGAAQSQEEVSALWNGFLPLDMGWGAPAQGFGLEGLGGFEAGELGMLF